LYLGEKQPRSAAPRMMEIIDPYLDDQQARTSFGRAENMAQKAKLADRRFVYLQGEPEAVGQVWQWVRPQDTIVAIEQNDQYKDINPDRTRHELTSYSSPLKR
jgi:hypothetical protein